jgi:hypothetical protein
MIVIGSRRIEFRLAARFPLASVSRQRPPAFRLHPDDGLALRDRARDARLDAAVAAGQTPLHEGPIHFGDLGLDPLVLPAVGEFRLHGLAAATPSRDRQARDRRQPRVVAQQPVMLPVVHDHGRH